jgi:hypothetical protein
MALSRHTAAAYSLMDAQKFEMRQTDPEQRLLHTPITVGIGIIAEYIIDSCLPSIETSAASFPHRHAFQAFRV